MIITISNSEYSFFHDLDIKRINCTVHFLAQTNRKEMGRSSQLRILFVYIHVRRKFHFHDLFRSTSSHPTDWKGHFDGDHLSKRFRRRVYLQLCARAWHLWSKQQQQVHMGSRLRVWSHAKKNKISHGCGEETMHSSRSFGAFRRNARRISQ